LAAYEELLTKTASTGAKIDIVLAMIRMQMFFGDKYGVSLNIERAQRYVLSHPSAARAVILMFDGTDSLRVEEIGIVVTA